MPKKYTSEQFWQLYKKLPEELQDALYSEENGNNIYDVCKRNGVADQLYHVVDYVGQVLVGVLPPEEFQEVLRKELKLKNEVAKKIAQEINRFIFYPVRSALEQLYKMEVTPSERPAKVTQPTKEAEERPLGKEESKETPGQDVYREPIE